MNKPLKLTFAFISIALSTTAQISADTKLPTVLMPSPEAAAINRASALSVSLNTGTASAGLPLYEIKMKDFTVPVSLNYSSTGVRVDEIPGRAGLGWSLTANGVITRLVHGKPDDQNARKKIPNLLSVDTALINFLDAASTTSGYDNEPDEFRISAPGLSAKFIIDDRNKPLFVPYSNLRVEILDGPWNGSKYARLKVTNTNGIEYYFGYSNAIETANNHDNGFTSVRTGFFLTKIKGPSGDSVEYHYNTISTNEHTGVSFFMQSQLSNIFIGDGCCPLAATLTTTLNTVAHATVYLSSVTASNGLTVNFGYESRGDEGGDNRLKTVTVSNGRFSKSWRCDYTKYVYAGAGDTYSILSDYNQRFFLTKVVALGKTQADSLEYNLEYNYPEMLPPRLSYSQDHWGYYNGQTNPNLLPPADGFAVEGGNTANRQPDGNSYGMLKKIQFPTGGYQEFITEPNVYSSMEKIDTHVDKYVSGSGDESTGWVTYYSEPFSVQRSQLANLLTQGYQNPGCPSCIAPPPNTFTFSHVYLISDQSDSVAYSQILREYSDINWTVSLDSGKVYKIKLMVRNQANAGTVTVKYDPASAPVYQMVEKPAGGVRIKQVISYDPVSGKSMNKFYRYTPLNSNNSSCINTSVFEYRSGSEFVINCQQAPLGPTKCQYLNLNSSTPQPLFLFDDSHIGYTSVIESDDEQFRNGLIQHEYQVYMDQRVDQLYGFPVNNLPTAIVTSINGYETRTSVYDNAMHLRKRMENYFNLHPDEFAQVDTAVSVRQRFDHRMVQNPWVPSYMASIGGIVAFDVASYQYRSDWLRLDSTIESEYDLRGVTMSSAKYFEYATYKNIAPRSNFYYDSKGDKRVEKFYYPNDLAPTPVALSAISKNMIDKPWRVDRYLNTGFLDSTATLQRDWFGDGTLIKPEKMLVYNAAVAGESRLRFYGYDAVGNVLEVSKEGDQHISYVWDYQKTLPVAEVKNASASEIAYNSFEADGQGNFTFDISGIDTTIALTGHNAYSLSGHTIQKTGLNPGLHYFLSYWTKSGSVSLSSGTPTSVLTRLGWTLYQADISGVSSVTLSGNASLDELRICPMNAQISSFTYEPLLGITSQNDNNNNIRFFEYDDFGRLKRVRDMDGNILSSYEYRYKVSQ